jgi:hypothetical protein
MFQSIAQIIAAQQDITTDILNIDENRDAAIEIQSRLCDLGLLDPSIDGDKNTPFGPVGKGDGEIGLNTLVAIQAFCQQANITFQNQRISLQFLETLVATEVNAFFPLQLEPFPSDSLQTRLAKCVLRFMQRKKYWIARSPNSYNIVYVEGMNSNGRLNDDTMNLWNDRRMVIRIGSDGQPEMLVNDQATTEPGNHYTIHPLDRKGAARIAFGQYKAWKVGLHHSKQPALVQRDRLRLHRDLNKDGRRSKNDPIDIGSAFGINQHTTSENAIPDRVGRYSAGCLVGRRYEWHISFLETVKQDVRYLNNRDYKFMSAVISGEELLRLEGV